jgi:hypothetical protein
MASSVLLDTTFLVSLVDDSRTNHQKAREFYKYFLDNKYPMILSSIATAEFCIRQKLTDLPLNTFRTLPFNIPDSHHLSSLFDAYFKKVTPIPRNCVKDDFKLLSQADFNNINYFITEDADLIKDFIIPLNAEGKLRTKPLFVADGVHKALRLPLPQNPLFK